MGTELHLYEKPVNYCLNAGNSNDDGSTNTANGWLNEAIWLVNWEEAKLSNGDKIIFFKMGSGKNHFLYPIPHDIYYHYANMSSGKVYCIDGWD